jgi:hypothetical protein
MTATATGRLATHEGRDAVAFERTFHAPITDVWAAVTESDRLVAAETGGDVSALVWDRDYWPALRDHYVAIVKELTAGGAPNLP